MKLGLIYRHSVHSFMKGTNIASNSKLTRFPHTLACSVFTENVTPGLTVSNEKCFIGADRVLSSALFSASALVPAVTLALQQLSTLALGPLRGALGHSELLQHFLISQEYFRPIFLFLISLIDFLNYVSAKRCLKKTLNSAAINCKAFKA